MRRHWSVLTVIGLILLLAQILAVAYEHTGSTRYFAWAPNDYAVEYSLQVWVHGRSLAASAIGDRYRLQQKGVSESFRPRTGFVSLYEAPAQQLIDTIRQREQTYGRLDGARVLLRYRLDGHADQEWRWPGR